MSEEKYRDCSVCVMNPNRIKPNVILGETQGIRQTEESFPPKCLKHLANLVFRPKTSTNEVNKKIN